MGKKDYEPTRAEVKSYANMKWSYHVPIILRYLKEEQTSYVPRAVTRFGKENFRHEGETVFLFDREVVVDKKRKHEILDTEEGRYGGVVKATSRILKKFIGISRTDVVVFFGGSERRQLKARYQKQKNPEAYIHARTPGTLQIDLTFYKNQKYPVFGAIDVFSRWCFYKRVVDKKASSTVEVLKECKAAFESISKHKLKKISTDSGAEWMASYDRYLKTEGITNDRQVKSRKLIEALNRILRNYNERLGWETLRDLDSNIERFVSDYNQTKHGTTNKTPNEMVSLKKTAVQNILNKVYGRLRVDETKPGFRMAKLDVGDTVRFYDPRRRELKAAQKKKLKGVIKLSKTHYVKRYTSFHRGNAPHWSINVYKVTKIIDGEKRKLYRIEGKKGVYVRSELQKVREVTKKDPRAKPEKKKETLEKRESKPPVKYKPEDPKGEHEDIDEKEMFVTPKKPIKKPVVMPSGAAPEVKSNKRRAYINQLHAFIGKEIPDKNRGDTLPLYIHKKEKRYRFRIAKFFAGAHDSKGNDNGSAHDGVSDAVKERDEHIERFAARFQKLYPRDLYARKRAPDKKKSKQVPKAIEEKKEDQLVAKEKKPLTDNQKKHRDKVMAMRKGKIRVNRKAVGRTAIIWYEGEDKAREDDPGAIFDMYFGHALIWHNSSDLQWAYNFEIVRYEGKEYSPEETAQWRKDLAWYITKAHAEIDIESFK